MYYILASLIMENDVNVCKSMMKRGGCRHIFLSSLQFKQWCKLFAKAVESQGDESNEEYLKRKKAIGKVWV